MESDAPIWIAAALAVASVALLRLSWGKPHRSTALNFGGWGALLAALVVGGSAAGEWGVAVTVLVATFVASLVLAFAATRPARKAQAKTVRTSHQSSEKVSPAWRSGWTTFTITGPLALIASVSLALAVRALIVMAGGKEADANVAVLATVPIAWPVLSFALLMMSRRARQFAWVFGIAALSAPFLSLQGGLS
ncbi:hypothetical protein GCM10011371_34920 [Novosphingobium marinum]|uniref:Uncharacterized protein n=1 Tax=Novosphingobium marinum TaxID=1514948 RepID=A0A7Y9XYZ3_9SPHN|nr:hypothetical protein [Novosphingobium marinum]NYH97197.1 hypothetical protein [Novosphingobium marinum]GGC44521.1 hypothetical protein GCM10011371_34920 [Novosphingobium marinum]